MGRALLFTEYEEDKQPGKKLVQAYVDPDAGGWYGRGGLWVAPPEFL